MKNPSLDRKGGLARWAKQLLYGYERALVVAGLNPHTVRVKMRHTRDLVDHLAKRGVAGASEITRKHLQDFLAKRQDRRVKTGPRVGQPLHPNTLLIYMASVHSFTAWMVKRGLLLLDPAADLPSPKRIRGLPRVLSLDEVDTLMATARGSGLSDLRDRALLELAYSSGLRCGELLGLDLTDLDLPRGEVLLRQTKGGRWRRVPVGDLAIAALYRYLREARDTLAGTSPRDPHAVFLTRKGTRLCEVNARRIMRRRVAQAELTGRVTLHTLRHTVGVHLLKGGADIRFIQELLGHRSLTTTAHYTRLVVTDLKDTLKRCHPRRHLRI